MLTQSFKKWFMAVRPSSLVITVMPVVLGTGLAFGDGIQHLPTALAALSGALMIHIATNLTNDYYDLKKGADKIGDTDFMRGHLHVGSVSQKELKVAMILSFLLVIPAAWILTLRAGIVIPVIAVFAVLAGYFYTAGKPSLGYRGWGDALVFLFFGPVAVAGTYYAQSLELNAAVILAGFAPGLLSCGVLIINNLRDYESDKAADKQTLVARFGKSFGLKEYLLAVFLACLMPVAIFLVTRDHPYSLSACLTLFAAATPVQTLFRARNTEDYNLAMRQTAPLLVVYTILFSLGWILS